MHKGLVYPYAADRLAVSSQFWGGRSVQGFIAAFGFLDFASVQLYPWTDLAGFSSSSFDVLISPDRETAIYEFPNPFVGGDLFVQVQVAYPAGVKSTSYNLVNSDIALPSPAGALNVVAAPQRQFGNTNWPDGPPVLPNTAYVAPDVIFRAAKWGEF